AFPDLETMIATFLSAEQIDSATIGAACFGVAGPVLGPTAELTNVPWRIDAEHLATVLGSARVSLLNDLQAMAHAVPVLEPRELVTLQDGRPVAGGNVALIAAGTGLGVALLHNVEGRLIPS